MQKERRIMTRMKKGKERERTGMSDIIFDEDF